MVFTQVEHDVVGFVVVEVVVFLVVVSPYAGGVLGRAETREVKLSKAMVAIFMVENMLNDCEGGVG